MTSVLGRPGWTIRPFDMADYEQVRDLWATAGDGLRLRPSDERDEIAKKLERDPELFVVAEIEGNVIGAIMGAWDGRRGWLHHLAVAGPYRCMGIGSALMAQVEEGLAAKGCLKINLIVAESNLSAIELYTRMGYDQMTGYVGMGKELLS